MEENRVKGLSWAPPAAAPVFQRLSETMFPHRALQKPCFPTFYAFIVFSYTIIFKYYQSVLSLNFKRMKSCNIQTVLFVSCLLSLLYSSAYLDMIYKHDKVRKTASRGKLRLLN